MSITGNPQALAEFRARLVEGGEQWVRDQIAMRVWRDEKVAFATSWLEEQAGARQAAADAEALAIARSAKDAAWESAREARRSSTAAHRSFVVSVIAALIALGALVVTYVKG